jgi:hypothetical protein
MKTSISKVGTISRAGLAIFGFTAAVSQAQLSTDQLVFYAPFDSTTSNTVGAVQSATVIGTPGPSVSSVQSKFGGASLYNPVADHTTDSALEYADGALSFDVGTGDYALSAWVYLSNNPTGTTVRQYLFRGMNGAVQNMALFVRDRRVVFFLENGTNDIDMATPVASLTGTGQWVNLIANIHDDGSSRTVDLYINGFLSASQTKTGVANTTFTHIVLAGTTDAGSGIQQGYMDDAAIWRRALTENEIQPITNNLVLYTPFDSTTSNAVGPTQSATVIGAPGPSVSSTQSKFGGASLYNPVTENMTNSALGYADGTPAFDVGPNGFALSAWVYLSNNPTGTTVRQYLFRGMNSAAQNMALYVRDRRVVFFLENGINDIDMATPVASLTATGQWVNLIANIYDNGTDRTVDLYINGELSASQTKAGVANAPFSDFYLAGTDASGSGIQQGYMDDAAIWTRKLSVSQIATIQLGSIVGTSGLPTFDDWADENGIPREPNGDFDHDGTDNLVEYALGLDPKVPDGSPGTFANGTLSFTKGATAVANGDVSYAIETSLTLEANSWMTVTDENIDPMIISYTLPLGQGKIFARLVISRIQTQ